MTIHSGDDRFPDSGNGARPGRDEVSVDSVTVRKILHFLDIGSRGESSLVSREHNGAG